MYHLALLWITYVDVDTILLVVLLLTLALHWRTFVGGIGDLRYVDFARRHCWNLDPGAVAAMVDSLLWPKGL